MMKTLLLAGAAGLATVSLAQAADVPMDKAEAVEYVKVCSEFGTGFFYIPGTDTCLKIGGRVRADYEFYDDDATADSTGFDSNAQLKFDARTATELGTLRSYIEVAGGDGKSLGVDKAYIQLGGLTAGYATSMFDSGIGVGDGVIGTAWASDVTTNLLAYTATFGGGFYATLSIEDGVNRRSSLRSHVFVPSVSAIASNASLLQSAVPSAAAFISNSSTAYGGHDVPDFVAAIGMSQDWGSAKVMGAIHEVTYATVDVDDEFGFAVGAAIELKAAGFTFGLQGNYMEGASSYIDDSAPDAVAYDGESEMSNGYAISSSVGFSISPALAATLYGSYKNVDWGTPGDLIADLTSTGQSVNTNAESYALGAHIDYTITPGLTVQLEGAYVSTDVEAATSSSTSTTTSTESTKFGVRLERTF